MSNCSSCNQPLCDDDDEEVTTKSGVRFHRTCLEQLLKPKSKTTPKRSNIDKYIRSVTLCTEIINIGKYKVVDDGMHETSSSQGTPCRYGGECPQINDKSHCRDYAHPDYCQDGGHCMNQTEDHLKKYRHLPLCPRASKCIDYLKEVKEHCNRYRHFAPRCPYGNNCALFHDKTHFEDFQHPFPTPCPRTPFDCPLYSALCESKNNQTLPKSTHQHCLSFAHVCKFGRNCTDTTQLHRSKSIHIARQVCPYRERCYKVSDEDHINSFTHPNIPDIRPLCPYRDNCREPEKLEHKVNFRHPITHEAGVVHYYGSNKRTNFVKNHKNNVACVNRFITKHQWKPLPTGTIPDEIINWIRTVQPIHRCSAVIFESILLHGYVMSRLYMERLNDPTFVADSVLHHSRIRRIEAMKMKTCEDDARQYVTALVCREFERTGFLSKSTNPATYATTSFEETMRKKENKLSGIVSVNDINALRTKAIEIARASIKLHSDPAGIGYAPDKALGTDKLVFSILGPHLGHYYDDIIIIFKRDILNHPDSNFSMQAATSFISGKAYNQRPWLDDDRGSTHERANHYHTTKLHASVPGYEYAAALELMAMTSLHFNLKTMDINLKQIFDRWTTVDSHQNIEAHLPQLIPLDYIDHIYIPRNIFDNLSDDAKRAIEAVFNNRITITDHIVEKILDKRSFGPSPNSPIRADYQNTVIKTLLARYKRYTSILALNYLKGTIITVPSTNLDDHYVLPLTISQAYEQYSFERSNPSRNNITYIYWKALHGDMMLTLSSEKIDPMEKQTHLRCLICYVATKSASIDDHYHEPTSYLAAAHPFQHAMITSEKKYAVKSNTLYVGCNSADFFTYCLEIHCSTGQVILTHAGPNAIYSRGQMFCSFNRSQLDLTKLEFVHISAGTHKVPVRELIICFEKQSHLHPTFDKDFTANTPSKTTKPYINPSTLKVYGDNDKRTLCKWGVDCYDHSKDHRSEYFHPSTSNSKKQEDEYRRQCRWGANCYDHSKDHRSEFSHP